MSSYLIIYNPVAGSLNKPVIDDVEKGLVAAGHQVNCYATKSSGDATHYLQKGDWQADVVVSVGGDGTANEVINGLKGFDVTLAVIPQGTTNILAKELYLPKKAPAILKMLLDGKKQTAYLAQINGRRFMLMAGIGYDSRVVKNVNLNIKKRFGKLAYVIQMIKEIFPFGSYEYEYRIDNGEWETTSSMIITKGKFYGGSFKLSQSMSLDKPYLQVFAFKQKSIFSLVRYLLMLPLGLMENTRGIKVNLAKKIEIRSSIDDITQIDGDTAIELPVTIKLEEKSISIIIPG